MPVVPATQEAEAGEKLEPGRRSLDRHCTPAWATELDSVSKKPKKKNENKKPSLDLFFNLTYISSH